MTPPSMTGVLASMPPTPPLAACADADAAGAPGPAGAADAAAAGAASGFFSAAFSAMAPRHSLHYRSARPISTGAGGPNVRSIGKGRAELGDHPRKRAQSVIGRRM